MRGILTDMGVTDGLEIHHDADLPARSGLGSSSSFTVGLLNALYALDSRMVTKRDLGREAIRIEQEVLKEDVGCQDQIWAAYGGFNRIDFHQDGTFSVLPFILPPARRTELAQSLMLFFTGFSRFATDFAQDQIKNMNSRKNQLRMIRSLVDSAADILLDPKTPLRELGELMHQSWQIKRELADSVSNSQIDEIYDAGRDAGAVGGKLLGCRRRRLHGAPGRSGKARPGPRAAAEADPCQCRFRHRRQQNRHLSARRKCKPERPHFSLIY